MFSMLVLSSPPVADPEISKGERGQKPGNN
jgi:hypothetical protein